MTGNDDRMDADVRTDAEICAALQSELRDARAEIAEAKRLLTDMNCERDHWQFAYEEAVQRAEQAESDLREAKAQHAIDENELVENTVKAHVRQMNAVGGELAAERTKVQRQGSLADRLAGALAIALYDAHPVYGSTAGWRGGIGGQAITQGCSMIDPPPRDDWMSAGYGLLSTPLHEWVAERGDALDLNAVKESVAAVARAALAGDDR